MLICFPGKGSGGGGVYGCGVWRVKSWVKNVLNTNKYIAISPIKWGWSPLTYLPLVVIIFGKSIILFYWTPYRGIDTFKNAPLSRASLRFAYWTPYRGIDTSFQRMKGIPSIYYWTPYRGIDTNLSHVVDLTGSSLTTYWTPYRGIDTQPFWLLPYFPTFSYWTPYRGIDTTLREWGIRNEQWTITFLGWTGGSRSAFNYSLLIPNS